MKLSLRARSGCRTGRFAVKAYSFTGERCSLRARPFGLSGWVTAATTWKEGEVKRACKLAQASSGVPIKITRNGAMIFRECARVVSLQLVTIQRSEAAI